MGLGIAETDFTNNALVDLGVTVSRQAATKTISNKTGSPTISYGTASDITAICTKRSQSYDWSKDGIFESGDLIMLIDKDQALNKDDLIVFEGDTFRIDTVILRKINGVQMLITANAFLVE